MSLARTAFIMDTEANKNRVKNATICDILRHSSDETPQKSRGAAARDNVNKGGTPQKTGQNRAFPGIVWK
jgi:hypothetical protein